MAKPTTRSCRGERHRNGTKVGRAADGGYTRKSRRGIAKSITAAAVRERSRSRVRFSLSFTSRIHTEQLPYSPTALGCALVAGWVPPTYVGSLSFARLVLPREFQPAHFPPVFSVCVSPSRSMVRCDGREGTCGGMGRETGHMAATTGFVGSCV